MTAISASTATPPRTSQRRDREVPVGRSVDFYIRRRLCSELFLFLLQTQSAALHPGIEFRTERVNRSHPVMQVPVNRHSLPLLPALDCGHVAIEVGRDFLPRIQPV